MAKQYQNGGFLQGGAKFVQIDGGVNTKDNDYTSPPPELLTQNNAWNIKTGEVRALPPVQYGNYQNAVMNPIYGLYSHEPTEPYTTGDILVHTELPDISNIADTAPALLGSRAGQSFAGLYNQASPLYPYAVLSRPFGSGDNSNNNVTTTQNPVIATSATLNIGIKAINVGSSVYVQGFDLAAGTFTSTALSTPGGTIVGLDAVEDPQKPGTFLVTYYNTTNTRLEMLVVNYLQIGITITLFTDATTNRPVNSGSAFQTPISFNGQAYVLQNGTNGTGNALILRQISNAGFGGSSALAGISALGGLGVAVDSSFIYIAYSNSTSTQRRFVTVNTGLTTTSDTLIAAMSNVDIGPRAVAINSTSTRFAIWSNAWAADAARALVYTQMYSQAIAAGVPSGTITANQYGNQGGSVLASKGLPLVGRRTGALIRTGALDTNAPNANAFGQPTYFLLDDYGRIVTMGQAGSAPVDTTLVNISGVTQPTASSASAALANPMPQLTNSGILSERSIPTWTLAVEGFGQGPWTSAALNGGQAIQIGSLGLPNVVAFSFSLLTLQQRAQLGTPAAPIAGRSQVLAGGVTTLYDGVKTVEAGWFDVPHWMNESSTGAGSNNPVGTYLYRAIYRWQDAGGQVHRSAPGPVFSKVQSATWNNITLNVPKPPFTYRNFATANIQNPAPVLELYRTDANGTVFYLVATKSLLSFTAPSGGPSAGYDTIVDSFPVTSSTTFGVAYPGYWQNTVQSSPPPSFIWQVTSQGRHFGLAQVNGGYRVYYTNVWAPGITVEWNTGGYVTCPPELGDCRSLAVLDDKVLVMGSVAVGVFNGLGPTGTPGANGIDLDVNTSTFSPIVPIPTSGGILGTGCPVTLPAGVMYQAQQGFMMLDRSLTATYAGSAVEGFTGVYGQATTIYGQACLLTKLQVVVFTNPQGDALVYDYVQKKWGVWQASVVGPISGAVQRRDGVIYLAQQPLVSATLPSTYTLNGNAVNAGVSVLYSPTNPAGTLTTVTGFTRATYQVETPWLPTGEVPAGEGALFEAAIFGTYFAPHILQVETAINYQGYGILPGDTVTFPVDSAPYPSYQFRVRPPSTDRVWAVKYRITVLPPAVPTLQLDLARLTGLMLFFATQQGNTRLGNGVSR